MASRAYERSDELIAEGEGQRVEFRAMPAHADLEQSMAKTIVAFANSRGGTIVVGVEPDGQVVGVEGDWIEQSLGRAARERTPPAVPVRIRRTDSREKAFDLVMVPPSQLHPHRLASNLLEYVRYGRVVRAVTATSPLRLLKS